MTKRALTLLIVAALLVGGAAVAIAGAVGGDDKSTPTHVMPNGHTMSDSEMSP